MTDSNVSPVSERALRQRMLASFRRSLPTPPNRIIVGFSGGIDSLALALLFRGTLPLLNMPIQLVHIDHRMREGSSRDAESARQLADLLDLPITVLTAEAPPSALHPGVGPEEAGRRIRFDLFAKVAGPGDVVALAHHAGDQAETVLLHLLRGAGLEGLRGMAEIGSIPVPWWDDSANAAQLPIWRPLLGESKTDLASLVRSSRLTPIEDESNLDERFRRNAIRHRLLPLMTELEPTIQLRLGTLARIARGENDLLEAQTAEAFGRFRSDARLQRKSIADAHPAIARRMIRTWAKEQAGINLTFDRVEAVRHLAASTNGSARIELGDHVVATVDRESLHLNREKEPGQR